MTEWGIDTLFNPGKRHMDEEKRRLQSTREEIGDSSGGKRIDLESGVVRIARPKQAESDDDVESDDAESEDAADDDSASDDPADETDSDAVVTDSDTAATESAATESAATESAATGSAPAAEK
jgi:hypothetical protein